MAEELVSLIEFVQSAPTKVSAGLVEGVLILGLVSKNNRSYSKAAIKAALPLYENAAVFVDHVKDAPRKADDRFGTLTNIRESDDGIRGDLKFLATHPMAARVAEDLSRDTRCFALSHNAMGSGKNVNGKMLIERIESVKSVDLVTGAATTRSLLEQTNIELEEARKVVGQSEPVPQPKPVPAPKPKPDPDPDPEPTPDTTGHNIDLANFRVLTEQVAALASTVKDLANIVKQQQVTLQEQANPATHMAKKWLSTPPKSAPSPTAKVDVDKMVASLKA